MNDKPTRQARVEEEAAETFVRYAYGDWTAADQAVLDARLRADPAFARAYGGIAGASGLLDRHAAQPQLHALADSVPDGRQPTRRRHFVAAAAGVVLAVAAAWQLSPHGYRPGQISTGIGEQRVVELSDRSRIALDSATRLRVRYTRDARIVELAEGQAQFTVARDPTRPFQVRAGDRSIVALGTVFTVEYVDKRMQVAMLEGKVAVRPHRGAAEATPARPHAPAAAAVPASSPPETPIAPIPPAMRISESTLPSAATVELAAGQALRIVADDRPVFIARADLEAATAWRHGKVVFRSEPLGAAARRMNRYSRLRVHIEDEALASRQFSGVFDVGDTDGFIDAVWRYLPVVIDRSSPDAVYLRSP